MRLQVPAAVAALILFPAAAYFFGRASPRIVSSAEPADSVSPVPFHSSKANPDPIKAISQLPFVELYRSLQAAPVSARRERVRELSTLIDLRQRRPGISSLFKCLAMINTDEALTFLPELQSDADRIKALDAIIKAAPSAATAGLIQRLVKMEGAVGDYFRDTQLPGQIVFWSALDPAAAAQFVDQHPELLARINETALLTNWAAIDPAAATAWLQNHPEFASNQEALNDYVYGLYQNDPEVARAYVSDNAADPRFARFVAPVAGRTFYDSPDVAETFIRGLSDPALRRRALSAIAALDTELLSSDSASRPAGYQQLADWLRKFPAEDRGPTLSAVFVTWEKKESRQAFHWLGDIPREEQQRIMDDYGQVAEPGSWPQIVSAVSEPMRTRFLAAVAGAWAGTAPEMENVARASGLAPKDAELLMRLVEKKQP